MRTHDTAWLRFITIWYAGAIQPRAAATKYPAEGYVFIGKFT